MNYCIPVNLEIEELLVKHPPTFKYRIDVFKYLLSLIFNIPASNKRLELFEGFTPISSKILKKKIPDYYQYFKYLKEKGIIEINDKYYRQERCKGYRFAPHFRNELRMEKIDRAIIKKYIKREARLSGNFRKKYNYLFKWLNKSICINAKEAREYNEWLYNERIQGKIELETNISGKPKDPYIQYTTNEINITKLEAKEFNPKIDMTGYRLHSTITNTKSELRNYITYDREEIISSDLKNSQPFLLTTILQPNYWTNNTRELSIHKVKPDKVRNYLLYNRKLFSSLMWEKFSENRYQQGFEWYGGVVEKGLYEFMFESINRNNEGVNYEFSQMKKAVFLILYSKNSFWYQRGGELKRLFARKFPEVYEFLRVLKSDDHKMLPVLLQNIESYVFLEKISKRIAKEKPDIPLITIHDNIATTKGNENYVEEVMKDELKRLVGLDPTIKLNTWSPENLKGEILYTEK